LFTSIHGRNLIDICTYKNFRFTCLVPLGLAVKLDLQVTVVLSHIVPLGAEVVLPIPPPGGLTKLEVGSKVAIVGACSNQHTFMP